MYKKSLVRTGILFLIALAVIACGRSSNQTTSQPNVAESSNSVSNPDVAQAEEEVVQEEIAQEHEEDAHLDTDNDSEADEHASDQMPDDEVEAGLTLFRVKACAGCHGWNGEGDQGPPLAGHTPEQVRRQVRTPQNTTNTAQPVENTEQVPVEMPPFTQEMLSDEELDLIIAWVESLGPATGEHDHAHGEHEGHMSGMTMDDGADSVDTEVAVHLRLAFFAVKDGNVADAEHHLQDLIAVLGSGEAQEMAASLLASLGKEADLHEVEHELEELMAMLTPGVDANLGPQFHLQLVMDSLTLDDVDGAQHHLEHYIDLSSGVDKIKAREALELVTEGEIHEVGHAVEELMGMTPHADH